MQFYKALILGQGISLAAAAGCAADNCARAVTGANNGAAFQSKAKSDCSSFIQVTIVPPTVTNTLYQTIFPTTTTKTITTLLVSETATVYPVTDNELNTITTNSQTIVSTVVSLVTVTTTPPQRRDAGTPSPSSSTLKASQIPAYASPCSGTVRYSSACSCWGILQSTTVLPTPTVSTVVIVTGIATQTQNIAFTNTQTLSLTTTVFSSVADSTTVTSTSTLTSTSVFTAPAVCAPTVPAGNILTNGGFNDGTFNGWNPGGNGGFSTSISNDAQCGAYGARFTVSASSSYARIGQAFYNAIDPTKNYQIRTYAKFVSGNGANCYYFLGCQNPNDYSAAGARRLDTTLSSIPSDWTTYSVNCPTGVSSLIMSLSVQCNQGSGPVTIGFDEIYMFPI